MRRTTNKSIHLMLGNQYCLRRRFKHLLKNSLMAVKDMYIVHLKPDQTKSVPERIDEWGVGSQNGHQELYITSHQPTRGRNSVL